MKLSELIECLDCGEVDAPNRYGRCNTCGSGQIAWLQYLVPTECLPLFHSETQQQMGVKA